MKPPVDKYGEKLTRKVIITWTDNTWEKHVVHGWQLYDLGILLWWDSNAEKATWISLSGAKMVEFSRTDL